MTYLKLNEHRVKFTKVGSVSVVKNTINSTTNLSKIRSEATIKIGEVLLAINKYYSDLEADENARYLSWKHCYKVFQEAHKKDVLTNDDIDYLSLVNTSCFLPSFMENAKGIKFLATEGL